MKERLERVKATIIKFYDRIAEDQPTAIGVIFFLGLLSGLVLSEFLGA